MIGKAHHRFFSIQNKNLLKGDFLSVLLDVVSGEENVANIGEVLEKYE